MSACKLHLSGPFTNNEVKDTSLIIAVYCSCNCNCVSKTVKGNESEVFT